MQLNFLSNVQLLPKLNKNAIDGIKIVAVVSAGGGKMQDSEIAGVFGLDALMVLEPLDQQSFLAHTSVPFNDKGVVTFWVFWLRSQPLLNHEIVFLQPTALLVLVEA